MGQAVLSGLWAQFTRTTAEQNPTLARHGVLGRSFAGRRVAVVFGPPPAVHFAEELARLSDLDLIRGPQRLSPGHLAAYGRDHAGAQVP